MGLAVPGSDGSIVGSENLVNTQTTRKGTADSLDQWRAPERMGDDGFRHRTARGSGRWRWFEVNLPTCACSARAPGRRRRQLPRKMRRRRGAAPRGTSHPALGMGHATSLTRGRAESQSGGGAVPALAGGWRHGVGGRSAAVAAIRASSTTEGSSVARNTDRIP